MSASSSRVPAPAEAGMREAVQALNNSNRRDDEARKVMVEANHTRKEIHKIRAELRQPAHADTRAEPGRQAELLTHRLEQLQEQGARLRAHSLEARAQALRLFEQGFYEKWKPWVTSRDPLAMEYSAAPFMAHNTQIRSTHPTLLNKMATPMDSLDRKNANRENRSLLVPALAAQNAPADLDTRTLQLSRDEHYLAHIEVQALHTSAEHNNSAAVPLNKMHKWRLLISDLSGNPVQPAAIDVQGHMPGHVHGLPSQPEVTAAIAPGVYLVEGVKFQMKGWWVIQFHITPADVNGKPDTLTFNLVL